MTDQEAVAWCAEQEVLVDFIPSSRYAPNRVHVIVLDGVVQYRGHGTSLAGAIQDYQECRRRDGT